MIRSSIVRNTDAGLLLTDTPLIVGNALPLVPLHWILVIDVLVRQLDHGAKMTFRVSHLLSRIGIVHESFRQDKEASEEQRLREDVALESLWSMLVETVVLSLEENLSLRCLLFNSPHRNYRQKLEGKHDKLRRSARDKLHRMDAFPSTQTGTKTERKQIQRRRALDLKGLRRLERRNRLQKTRDPIAA